ncbi:response regulator transcription factor [Candidatus Magnetominusculus xianensis]|uniref:DNA-binding response regulator n=1 Tax=Candidatus Magnetominusculus xianensis TaxID=1748249 RepID=A0ABR5SEP7_9BACT|nr:response regulator transcription factor [Candidatus Magnetominusculus xianensis]KWT85016.1 DNA-binding response regulator [Candidatus Magnetominusculus xianensis]MBF0404516.1 response regulator transcription factor [Nitrospirota bacterium]
MRVIVVEDDAQLRDILVTGLTYFGFDVRGVWDGSTLDAAIAEKAADVVVLDLGLPGEDGIEIINRLRKTSECGVVVVTARGRLDDRLKGLKQGADHYFVKPVDLRELAAVITNLGQRLTPVSHAKWIFIEKKSLLMTPNGVEVPLTGNECIVVSLFAANPGINIQRTRFFEKLDYLDDHSSNLRLEALISRLRFKVHEADPASRLPVHARHSQGYAFLDELGR